jgi:hypothetical protein
MIQWYGAGGDWINEGLPHYVAIDRKPENSCEIQNAACGKTGIMMELHVVKGPAEERLNLENDDDEDLGHGCKIMLHFVAVLEQRKQSAELYVLIPTMPLSKLPVDCLI